MIIALIVLGFSVLRVPKAVVNCVPAQSEKTGMRVIATEERDYVSGRLLTEIWEITSAEWREKRLLLRANEEGELPNPARTEYTGPERNGEYS